MERKNLAWILDRLGERKLLSSTLVLFTLAIGIILGTLISTNVDAAREKQAAPDAKLLSIPDPVPLENEFTRIARQIRPSVVHIRVEAAPVQLSERRSPDEGNRTDEFFRRFFGLPEGPFGDPFSRDRRRPGEGSGVIVDENGYIITNYHVVEKADRIKVTLPENGRPRPNDFFDAKLIGYDQETDLAVIKIEAKKKLHAAKIGNSAAVNVGDWSIAVGSPFGYRESVTVGIISAKGRSHDDLRAGNVHAFQKFLQTDAAINPGNSGGPLVNIRGEVIGINTAIVTQNGGYQGLGFALASNIAVDVYNQIIQHGKVRRGSIGITFQSDQDPALLRTYGAKDGGVLVGAVKENGPADKAGMKPEDVIVEIDGNPVANGEELISVVAATPVDSTVPVVIMRGNERKTLQVRIADRAELFGEELGLTRDEFDQQDQPTEVMFGVSVLNLTPAQIEELQLEESGGVLVKEVEPTSFADHVGLRENDIIVAINRQPINNVNDVREIQNGLRPGDDVAFKVLRQAPGAGRGWVAQYLAGVLPEGGGERF